MRLVGLMVFVLAASVTSAAAQSPQEAESIYKTRCDLPIRQRIRPRSHTSDASRT
jgi:hypothetical protein